MNIPVAVSNIVVGLFAEESVEAEAHLQSICEHFTALSQGAVTVPSKFDSDTFPGVTWQDGTIHLQFVRCVQGGTVPGTSTPLDVVLNVVHCPGLDSTLLEMHTDLCRQVQDSTSGSQIPVETLGFYPSDAQLGDPEVASNRALHLVLEGQEQMACQFLLANSVTAVLDHAVARTHSMQKRTGIQAHNLLGTAQSGALPHLLDGRAVAGAAALCCTAANACIAMDDCGSAADYALIGQRLIDTSLRDIALGAADLLETNRLSVQCALSLGSAAWLSVAPQTTPQAKQPGTSPRRSAGLNGHSVRRWMASADAFEQGAVSAGSVAQADPHAHMLLSPLPPWAHAALMFASAGVAYSVAAQTMLEGAPAVPMPADGAPGSLLSPSKAGGGGAGSPAEPWATARQAQQALLQASTFAASSLSVFTQSVGHSSGAANLSPQLTLAADVALRVAATTACCLLTSDNLICRTPRRAWSIFTGLARDLSRAGAVRHAVLLSCAGLGTACPEVARRLAALLQAHMQAVEAQHQGSHHGTGSPSAPAAGVGAASASLPAADSPASSHASSGSPMQLRTEDTGDHDTPAGFEGVKASASARQPARSKSGSWAQKAECCMRPALQQAVWPVHLQDLYGSLAASLLTMGCSRTVVELSLLWGEGRQAPLGPAQDRQRPPGAVQAAFAGDFCDPLLSHNAAHTMVDALLEPQQALEHLMHVHTLQACLHGTPCTLDFALGLRISHFLEPQLGSVLPPHQRPWSTEALWTSFLEESSSRAASGSGQVPVSAVSGFTLQSAQWAQPTLSAAYHVMPKTDGEQGQSAPTVHGAADTQPVAFQSPASSRRSRKPGRRRASSANHVEPQLTHAYGSVHDTLQIKLECVMQGVVECLARSVAGSASAGVRIDAIQGPPGLKCELFKAVIVNSKDSSASFELRVSDLMHWQVGGSIEVLGVWLEVNGLTWLQALPSALEFCLVHAQPILSVSPGDVARESGRVLCPIDVQCNDSAELQLEQVTAALCSGWQAQRVLEGSPLFTPDDCQACEIVLHGGTAFPAAAGQGKPAPILARVTEGCIQIEVPTETIASVAQQHEVGVGDELKLIVWILSAPSSPASFKQLGRRIVYPIVVPATASAWQSNQGPWDPESASRVRFWQAALAIKPAHVLSQPLVRCELQLECCIDLLPQRLITQFRPRDEEGQENARACASFCLRLQGTGTGCVWLGSESVVVADLATPRSLGCLIQPAQAGNSTQVSLSWCAIIAYQGSGNAYSVSVPLEVCTSVVAS